MQKNPLALGRTGLKSLPGFARLGGFEPPASGTGIQRSIHLSYKRKGHKYSNKLPWSFSGIPWIKQSLCKRWLLERLELIEKES